MTKLQFRVSRFSIALLFLAGLTACGGGSDTNTGTIARAPAPTSIAGAVPAGSPAGATISAPAPVGTKIQLPIEVFGAQGTTTSITFNLSRAADAATATDLWLQTHNVRYAGKASVKINDAAWVYLNNTTVKMTGTSAPNQLAPKYTPGGALIGVWTEGYGGIGGTLAVLKMKLPIAANTLKQGNNTITFRFNTSNGVSMGYRVINMNLLTATGQRILPASAFEESAPASWAPPSSAQADIDAGKNLWMTAQLKNNYLPGANNIIAKCADCHTATGFDLKYFGYSNKSIIERAKFHGLSDMQGTQIASYIRTLPVKAVGRPWNPPYQPGPGLTSKPNGEWAAGAGIDNVLDDDWDTIKAIFPNGIKRDALMIGDSNKFKRYGTHDTPLAFQLPDWNHWLPEVHPYDAFGKANIDSTKNFKMYNEIRRTLEGKTPAQIRQWFTNSHNRQPNAAPRGYFAFREFSEGFPGELRDRGWIQDFNGDNRTNPIYLANARNLYSAQLWKMVKHFELHEGFDLTGMGKEAINIEWAGFDSKQALPRMWMGAERVVFDVSPFLVGLQGGVTGSASGNNDLNYDYLSNSWYQLQLILNAGQRSGHDHRVIDWGYAYGFMQGFDAKTNSKQSGRNVVWALAAMDEADNGKGPNQPDGWNLRRTNVAGPVGFIREGYIWSDVWINKPTAEANQVRDLLNQVFLEKNATWLPVQYWFKDINGNLSEDLSNRGNQKEGWEDGAYFPRPVESLTGVSWEGRNMAENTLQLLTGAKFRNTFPAALQNGYATWAQAVWPGLNGANLGQWAAVKAATQGVAPAAPSLSNGTGAGTVNVSWQALAGATSYNVKRSESANGPFMTVAYFRTGTGYIDTVPVPGRTYYYRVSSNSNMNANESPDSLNRIIAR